jgi:hypothetical protein
MEVPSVIAASGTLKEGGDSIPSTLSPTAAVSATTTSSPSGPPSHEIKDCIMKWGLYKWLYVILKKDSPEIAAKACDLITLLAYSSLHGNLICDSGIIRIILLLLEKYPHHLRVQYDGLRAILTLCQVTQNTIKIIKILKGEKVLKATRKYLKQFLITAEETKTKDLLLKNKIRREEIEEVYSESSVKKKLDQCFLS